GGDNNKTPVAGTKAVQYTVLFDVDNSDGELMPQMTAQVIFMIASASNVLTVPIPALSPVERKDQNDLYQARILGQDGQVQVRELQLGIRNRLQGEVVAGLKEGEQIIVSEQTESTKPRRFRW
ncbi:MAG TPA: efflux RND transporter periplasmic adaptor subunit, partial [Nitrosomonas europaea]|nr:efflux RND transporter periplasmic adaptor subunit [Nitrosomonas europaea]